MIKKRIRIVHSIPVCLALTVTCLVFSVPLSTLALDLSTCASSLSSSFDCSFTSTLMATAMCFCRLIDSPICSMCSSCFCIWAFWYPIRSLLSISSKLGFFSSSPPVDAWAPHVLLGTDIANELSLYVCMSVDALCACDLFSFVF